MKRFLHFFLCAALLLCCTPLLVSHAVSGWDGSIAAGFSGGNGTQNDPYQIASASQLALLGQIGDGQYGVLTQDIRLDGANWHSPLSFDGILDGQEHTISGMETDQGALIYTNKGEIKNLILKDIDVTHAPDDVQGSGLLIVRSNTHAAGIAVYNSGSIHRCLVSGRISGEYAGGIAGKNEGLIYSCSSSAEVYGEEKGAGGIAAENYGEIRSCRQIGVVAAYSDAPAGGIVGHSSHERPIKFCYNSGTVSAVSGYAGGIVGEMEGCLRDCYNAGHVFGDGWVGGLCGSASGTYTSSASHLPDGDVNKFTTQIENCYSVGEINGEYSRGLLGSIGPYVSIWNCFCLDGSVEKGAALFGGTESLFVQAEVDGYGYIGETDIRKNCTFLTQSQFCQQGSFSGYDFAEVWQIGGYNDYDYPSLRGTPHITVGRTKSTTESFSKGSGSDTSDITEDDGWIYVMLIYLFVGGIVVLIIHTHKKRKRRRQMQNMFRGF